MTASTSLDLVVLGLSITSSWGNGHATTYRGLIRALADRGHRVLFLECDVPWYAANRDLPQPPFCETELYQTVHELRRWRSRIREADLVIIGSYVPEGVAAAEWVLATAAGPVAFYDIDTPVTLAQLDGGTCEYLRWDLIPRFDLYLSFTGGPTLRRLERELGAQRARALYCSVDPELYYPEPHRPRWDLGYMGTYSDDRQPTLERLLIEPARRVPQLRFCVAGPQYPASIAWPPNVDRETHLAPSAHRTFYNRQRFTLNVTRADMIAAGWSPSVRLFEAAACGTPIISDRWQGLETLFEPGEEILIADTPDDVVRILGTMSEEERLAVGQRARARVLAQHTAAHRAQELEEQVSALYAGASDR
jgi:spore maturation protein CgeB